MDTDKLIYAAKLLMGYAGGSLQRTHLNKALFYLDLYWLADRGQTFTGTKYVALPNGPVVDNYRTVLIEPLINSHGAIEEIVHVSPGIEGKLIHLRNPVTPPTDQHLELLARRVIDIVKSAVDISEVSHQNLAWGHSFALGSGTPINMVLALEQVSEEDPWVNEDFTPEEQAYFEHRLSANEFQPLE